MIETIIGLLAITLASMFVWVYSLSLRKARLEQEKREKDKLYKQVLAKSLEQEKKERLAKAEFGHIPSIFYAAKEAEKRKNYVDALKWYEKAAFLNSPSATKAIINICQLHPDNLVLKDKLKFWHQVNKSQEGDLEACYLAATMLLDGNNMMKNDDKALEWLEHAASHEHINAILFLGNWYQSTSNPKQNIDKAIHWNRIAARLGSSTGMIRVGFHYLNGLGTEIDTHRAAYWFERSSELGNTKAMLYAGKLWMGRKNSVAYIWLYLASEMGEQDTLPLRDEIAQTLGVDNMINLQGLARPLLISLEDGSVVKHSITRALNNWFRRSVPIPHTQANLNLKLTEKEHMLINQLSTNHHEPAPQNGH
ncbi:tetratricopeptide repeat protein [Vibrio sp. FNV 38]|nr:tetratricopeptide repeat protein [Vibrio sp. FNV 38]